MNYLNSYNTFDFVYFQWIYLGLDGKLLLLTLAPDLKQTENTSILEDMRIYVDGPDINPALELNVILRVCACEGLYLRVESDNYGLTTKNGKLLDSSRASFLQPERYI